MLKVAVAVLVSLMVVSHASAEPRVYDADLADQFLEPLSEDTVPLDPIARRMWAEHTAFEAAVFARAAILTYGQMYEQAIDQQSAEYVGFNAFLHGRELAGPGYKPFKSPNADTLYSNAYLDLSSGPVILTVPPTNGRYYTANFLDLFGNATNISARTHGMEGGRYLIATTDWEGETPEGLEMFRVTQPFIWILLRIEAEDQAALPEVHELQDRFVITPTLASMSDVEFPEPAVLDDADSFLSVLDWVIEVGGIRQTELAQVHAFRGLGVGGPRSIEEALSDDETRQGVSAGLSAANDFLERTKVQNGADIGGWTEPFDLGRYGYNYIYRSSVNSLGTGANVRLENFAFTTFKDANGEPLNGSHSDYVLHLPTAPPADYFWSVTVYDLRTQELVPNADNKYLVGANTKELQIESDGSINIIFARKASGPNSIPIPDGPFYLALRAQGPRQEMVAGLWKPSPVQRIDSNL